MLGRKMEQHLQSIFIPFQLSFAFNKERFCSDKQYKKWNVSIKYKTQSLKLSRLYQFLNFLKLCGIMHYSKLLQLLLLFLLRFLVDICKIVSTSLVSTLREQPAFNYHQQEFCGSQMEVVFCHGLPKFPGKYVNFRNQIAAQ